MKVKFMSYHYLIRVLPYYLILGGILSVSVGLNVTQYNIIKTQSNMINRMMIRISYMSLSNYDIHKNRR